MTNPHIKVEQSHEEEWEYSVGHLNGDGTYSAEADWDDEEVTDDIDEARSWVADALDSGTYNNAVLVRKPKSRWEPVPEKDNDYWVDGHFIHASMVDAAKAEYTRMYGGEPETVREWRNEDQAELEELT